MNTTNFDAITKTASRRGSLFALGGAGLAAVMGSVGTVAKPKAGKLARKKVKEKCKAQVGQCNAAFKEFCGPEEGGTDCVQRFSRCCDLASTCNVETMIACILTTFI